MMHFRHTSRVLIKLLCSHTRVFPTMLCQIMVLCQLIAFLLCDHAIPECELHLWSALPPTFFQFFLSLYCSASVKYRTYFFVFLCQFMASISWGGNHKGYRFSYGRMKNSSFKFSFGVLHDIFGHRWTHIVALQGFYERYKNVYCQKKQFVDVARRIRMFLASRIRIPDPSIIKQKAWKTLIFLLFCEIVFNYLWLFIFEDCRKCTGTF
jgi:hypothetical protein